MTIRGAAQIAGVFEHPSRTIPDRTTPQIHAEVAVGVHDTASGHALPRFRPSS